MRLLLSVMTSALLALPLAASAGSPDCSLENDHPGDHFGLFDFHRDQSTSSVQILDLFLFSLVDSHSHQPDYSSLEILQAPLISGYESRRSDHGHRTRVLDVPLFSLYRSESHGSCSDMGVLNLPLIGSLFRQRVDEDQVRTNVLFLMSFERPVTPAR